MLEPPYKWTPLTVAMIILPIGSVSILSSTGLLSCAAAFIAMTSSVRGYGMAAATLGAIVVPVAYHMLFGALDRVPAQSFSPARDAKVTLGARFSAACDSAIIAPRIDGRSRRLILGRPPIRPQRHRCSNAQSAATLESKLHAARL